MNPKQHLSTVISLIISRSVCSFVNIIGVIWVEYVEMGSGFFITFRLGMSLYPSSHIEWIQPGGPN